MVLFLAIEDFSLLVVLHSHTVILSVYEAVDLAKACGGDEVAARNDAVETWGDLELKRVHVRAGDLVLMSGLCVHSGDEGRVGVPALRAHWYVQQEPLKKEVPTHPLLAQGGQLAHKLGFPKGRSA